MAFGHAVKRGGFDDKQFNIDAQVGIDTYTGGPGDELLRGNNDANMIDGAAGDDVIIGKGGDDHLVGGDGEDDLSGGEGDDLLVGAMWEDENDDSTIDADDKFTQDDFSDDYNAEATFAENGTDTIWYYDADPTDSSDSGVVDFIDLSEPIEFVDTDDSGTVEDAEMLAQLNGEWSYDDGTGALSNSDGTWFNVYSDAGTTAAETVYLEVDGNQFTWDTGADEWTLVA